MLDDISSADQRTGFYPPLQIIRWQYIRTFYPSGGNSALEADSKKDAVLFDAKPVAVMDEA